MLICAYYLQTAQPIFFFFRQLHIKRVKFSNRRREKNLGSNWTPLMHLSVKIIVVIPCSITMTIREHQSKGSVAVVIPVLSESIVIVLSLET